jgi:bacteriorhodopsin
MRKRRAVILIVVVCTVVICAIAYFLLKADRVPSNRAAAYAVAFAVVFFAGA